MPPPQFGTYRATTGLVEVGRDWPMQVFRHASDVGYKV